MPTVLMTGCRQWLLTARLVAVGSTAGTAAVESADCGSSARGGSRVSKSLADQLPRLGSH
jgi:hypothetical protein